MKKIIISEEQIGIKYENGAIVDILEAGSYFIWNEGKTKIEIYEAVGDVPKEIQTGIIRKHPKLMALIEMIEIDDNEIGLLFKDGKLSNVLLTNTYRLWKVLHTYEVIKVDILEPEIDKKYMKYINNNAMLKCTYRYSVPEGNIGILYIDNKYVKQLEPGEYRYWMGAKKVRMNLVDMRQQQVDVSGQELLTEDRVSIRMNLVCQYRVVDAMKYLELKDATAQLYATIQLAVREYVGNYKFDDLMSKKDEVSDYILQQIKAYGENCGVAFHNVGIKDIILPGDIKTIFNSVLIAEKQAQASVITRREEVASTRSLLNTAKMMEENPTLYRLKEMEYIERICDHIGELSVGGNGSIMEILNNLIEDRSKSHK